MRCKHCKEKFIAKYFNQKFCMVYDACIKAFSESVQAMNQKAYDKRNRERKKVMKEKLKTLSEWKADLQLVFNKFIRERDKDKPCISCGTTNDVKYDAGHFYHCGGYPGLRFDEDNCHKQCSNNCNIHLSGNFAEYSINLPKRIGQERFEALTARRHQLLHLTVFEIKEMIVVYKEKLALLKQKPSEKVDLRDMDALRKKAENYGTW